MLEYVPASTPTIIAHAKSRMTPVPQIVNGTMDMITVLEVMIVREHLLHLVLAHRFHRNAVGEAVLFVLARFIELEPQ